MRVNCVALTTILTVILFVGFVPPTCGQTRRQPGQEPTQQDEDRVRMEKDMAKKANKKRQADLKRDTDKLLELATELKQYVDKSNENVLSMEVIQKAEEIEKLAHSVKDKMKGN